MVCCRCTEREEPRLFPPIESDLFADVSAVSALTSWVPLKFNFFDKTDEEIWSFLLENLDLFRYEELKSKSKDGSKSRKSTATLRTAKSSNSTVSSSTRTIIREVNILLKVHSIEIDFFFIDSSVYRRDIQRLQ